jgi:hypothetical protein
MFQGWFARLWQICYTIATLANSKSVSKAISNPLANSFECTVLPTFTNCHIFQGLQIPSNSLPERIDNPLEQLANGIGHSQETFARGLPH